MKETMTVDEALAMFDVAIVDDEAYGADETAARHRIAKSTLASHIQAQAEEIAELDAERARQAGERFAQQHRAEHAEAELARVREALTKLVERWDAMGDGQPQKSAVVRELRAVLVESDGGAG